MEIPVKTPQCHPPSGLWLKLARMPIWLYRLRLGWLLGNRFLMITHTGRKSGLPRQTVVEVVRRDAPTGAYIVASGWGEKSDWFLNIQKTPEVTLQVGLRRFRAVAARLSSGEVERELLDYGKRYPLAFRALTRRLIGKELIPDEESCRLIAQFIPLISFRPQEISASS